MLALLFDASTKLSTGAARILIRSRNERPDLQPLFHAISTFASLRTGVLAGCRTTLNKLSITDTGDVPWDQAASSLVPFVFIAPHDVLLTVIQTAASNTALHPVLVPLLTRSFPELIVMPARDGTESGQTGSHNALRTVLYEVMTKTPDSMWENRQLLAAFARFVPTLIDAPIHTIGVMEDGAAFAPPLEISDLLTAILMPGLAAQAIPMDLVLTTALATLCSGRSRLQYSKDTAVVVAALKLTWTLGRDFVDVMGPEEVAIWREITLAVVEATRTTYSDRISSIACQALMSEPLLASPYPCIAAHLPLLLDAGLLNAINCTPVSARFLGSQEESLRFLRELAKLGDRSALVVQALGCEALSSAAATSTQASALSSSDDQPSTLGFEAFVKQIWVRAVFGLTPLDIVHLITALASEVRRHAG